MTVASSVAEPNGGWLKIPLTASTTTGGADALALVNPEATALVIDKVILYVATVATGSATIDVGVAATAVTNDTLFDGLDVHAATGLFNNVTNKGTNGLPQVLWPVGYYLTATPSATLAGLVATAYVHYLRV